MNAEQEAKFNALVKQYGLSKDVQNHIRKIMNGGRKKRKTSRRKTSRRKTSRRKTSRRKTTSRRR